MNCIKTKNLNSLKDTIKRVKPTKWDKIFSMHIFDKSLKSRI